MDNRYTPTVYTYESAGFTGFFNRGLGAMNAPTLRAITNASPRREINFDQTATSGNLGDVIQAGGIKIDGPERRIAIVDELSVEVGWVGKIED